MNMNIEQNIYFAKNERNTFYTQHYVKTWEDWKLAVCVIDNMD